MGKRKWMAAVRVTALLALLASAGYVGFWFFRSRRNEAVYQAAAEQYVRPAEIVWDEGIKAQNVGGGVSAADIKSYGALASDEVDFEGLWKESRDVVGWIKLPDFPVIDYPVVFRDDDYYLERTWNGISSPYGSIFLEEQNTPDFTDYHSILYGHRMVDRSMFGMIEEYLDPDFYAQHQALIVLYTPEGALVYKIFAMEHVMRADPIVYTVGFCPGEEYTRFLEGLVERSSVDTGVEVLSTDRVLTLSTCAYGDKDRLTVHAKLVYGYLMEQE